MDAVRIFLKKGTTHMKDKRSAMLKKRRREERSRRLEQSKNNFMQAFNAHLEKYGTNKKYDRELVWKAQKQLRNKLQHKSRMYCLYTTMYCLHKIFGWSEVRLIRFCNEVIWIAQAIIDGDRTLEQLAEELKDETGLDIYTLFNERSGHFDKNASEARMVADCVLAEMPQDMIIGMYALYNYNGFKAKRIKRIAEAVRTEVEDVLVNERLPEIQENLRKCHIEANDEGGIKIINSKKRKA